MKLIPIAISLAMLVAGCASVPSPAPLAQATLQPTQGNITSGSVSFTQKGDQLVVDARVTGLTPGPHGFHVHEKGDCSAPDGASAGGHFNPSAKAHGSPAHAMHHGGDFGNLVADAGGQAVLQLTIPLSEISLAQDAPNSVLKKGVIVHADPDDYLTQPTGNSGKRLACGVITLK